MSSFLTQCPFCQTSFKVSEEQMHVANGVVRCGACMEVFLAGQHRIVLKNRTSRPDIFSENPPGPEAGPAMEPDDEAAAENAADTAGNPGDDATPEDWLEVHDPEFGDGFTGTGDPVDEDMDNGPGETGAPWEGDAGVDPTGETGRTDADVTETTPASIDLPHEDEPAPIPEDDAGEMMMAGYPDREDVDSLDDQPDVTAYDTFLDPSGYRMSTFSVHHELSPLNDEFPGNAPDRDMENVAADAAPEARSAPLEPPGAVPGEAMTDQDDSWVFEEEPRFPNPDLLEDAVDADAGEESIYLTPVDTDAPADESTVTARAIPATGNGTGLEENAGMAGASRLPADAPAAPQESRDTGEPPATFPPDDDGDTPPDTLTDTPPVPTGGEVVDGSDTAVPGHENVTDVSTEDADAGTADETPGFHPAPAPPAGSAEEEQTLPLVHDDLIPTLVPDRVAREDIPQSRSAAGDAWTRSLRSTPPPDIDLDDWLDGQTPAGDKSRLHDHLSRLTDEESLEPVDRESLAAIDEEPIEFVQAPASRSRLKTAAWLVAGLLLAAGLAGQYLWYHLDDLVRAGRLPQVTAGLCRLTDCPSPGDIDLASLVTEELVVRSDPGTDDALLVNFIFRNDADREQPFPLVELDFTDNSGKVLANRVFSADEYLPPEMALFSYMPAHSSIQVSLALVDPGPEATGYSLVYRNP